MFLKEIKEHVTLFVLSAFSDSVISSIILRLLRIAADTKKKKTEKRPGNCETVFYVLPSCTVIKEKSKVEIWKIQKFNCFFVIR